MPIRWDKFTVKAQEAVQRANELASEHGNPELAPLHLLAALVEDREGIVAPVLEKIGIGPQAVLSDLYKEIEKLPKVSGSGGAQPPAMSSADQSGSGEVFQGSRHLQGRIRLDRAHAAGADQSEARSRRRSCWRVTARRTTPS